MEPLKPLVQTITNLYTSAGSQDNVFGISGRSNQCLPEKVIG